MKRSAMAFVFGMALSAGCTPGLTRDQHLLLEQAHDSYDRKQYAAAIGDLSRLIEQLGEKPAAAAPLYLRAMCHLRNNQRAAAYADLQQCVKFPDDKDATWRAYAQLGALHYEDGQWDYARRAYLAALPRMPKDEQRDVVLFRAGACYERLGRWAESRAPFEQCAAESPASVFGQAAARRLVLCPTNFAIQCGIFADPKNAERLRSELARQNLPAYVQSETRNRSPVKVVLVGRYASYEDAQRQLPLVQRVAPEAVLWP